jgi:hypothetical protein
VDSSSIIDVIEIFFENLEFSLTKGFHPIVIAVRFSSTQASVSSLQFNNMRNLLKANSVHLPTLLEPYLQSDFKREYVPSFELQISLTLIGMSYENKKNAHLKRHLGASFIRLNELGRVSNYPD